jgi:hypothetical protein
MEILLVLLVLLLVVMVVGQLLIHIIAKILG